MDLDPSSWSTRQRYGGIAATIFLVYLLLGIVFGRHELPAYDVYSYISFADHYASHWFHTRAPAVAHGLELVSYPPLVFQIMALLSFLPLLSFVHIALVLISLGAVTFSFSFYLLFRTLTGFDHEKAPLLILVIAFSPGLLKFVLVHGQLPLMFGLTFGCLAVTCFHRILDGERDGVYLALALALTAYTHHFSFLITTIMIAVIALLNVERVASRSDYLVPVFLVAGALAAVGLHSMVQEMLFGISQGRIFHGSRNPVEAMDVFHQFLTTTYGVAILAVPLLLWSRLKSLTVNVLTLVFMIIGLGLVTPVPDILFGGFAEFLTYDRFSLIASLFLAGLLGAYLLDLPDRFRMRSVPTRDILLLLFILLGIGNTFAANVVHHGAPTGYTRYNATQTQVAIGFLQENASDDYLYVTRGHWPPVDEIRLHTDVPTLDTGYYPGRDLGFLASSAKFDRIPPDDFRTVLRNAENLSLKYVLTFDRGTDTVMREAGWERQPLDAGVVAWINPDDIPRYEPDLGPRRPLFGLMPLLTLLVALSAVASSRIRRWGEILLQRLRGILRAAATVDRDRLPARGVAAAILFLPAVAAAPAFLTSGAYPAGIDTPAHLFKADLIGSMIAQHGQVYRWTTMWYNGYPFLAMYPPLGTYLLAAVTAAVQDTALAYNLVRLAALVGLAAAVYALTRRVLEERRGAVFAMSLAVLSYPLYNNLFTVGRFASALALPVYIFLIQVLLRDDIFQRTVSRGHLLLAAGSAVLFLTHSLLAYLFVYTGIIFLIVYRDRLPDLGIRPVAVTAGIPLLLGAPYLARLLRHRAVTNPRWYVVTGPIDLAGHVAREFTNSLPNYTGMVHVALLLFALSRYRTIRDRFLRFSIANAAFFYLLFWLRNFWSAPFIPFFSQFDQARFEILFTVFAVFIAAYGFRHLMTEGLPDLDRAQRNIFVLLLIGLVFLDVAPMLSQSANWNPAFADELDDLPVDGDHRALGVGMRQWDAYVTPQQGIPNVFGWFNQANPNFLFTRSLQETGGRWFEAEAPSAPIPRADPELRKTLMEISNTKYVIAAQGDWLPADRKQQVTGLVPTPAPKDTHLIYRLSIDPEFTSVHDTEHLRVFRLDRDMSYCDGISPVWIQENYAARAVALLATPSAPPLFPVNGTPPDGPSDAAATATCEKPDPYTLTVNVSEPGWLLVKESYYPFWERENGEPVYDGFGFMVIDVRADARLRYTPP